MMPMKKSLGRWPVVFADYSDAVNGKINPIPREVFLDYQGKDAYFYSPTGEYVSIIGLIKAGMVDTYLPPCVSFEVIKATYPDPDLSSICAALDTGIIYEYVGNGAWIPISANSISLASSTTNGLMSAKNYDQLQDCANRYNIIFVDLNGDVPLPYKRPDKTIYEICMSISVDPNEVIYDALTDIDSVESAIRDPWDYDQLFDFDLETGEIFEITDGLYKIIASDMLIDPDIVVPDGYMYVHFMYAPANLNETLDDTKHTANAYDDTWEFERFYDYNSNNELSIVTNVGYTIIFDKKDLGSMNDRVGKNGIESVYYMATPDVFDDGDSDDDDNNET
jgi:hypothetical protein